MSNLTQLSKNLMLALTCFGISIHHIYADQTEDAFTHIYNNKTWGSDANGNGTSGPGSALENTVEYRTYLQDFLKTYHIKTVIDVGCGDWMFSQAIDWTGIQYTGYDVVKSVIQNNQERFQAPNLTFIHGNPLFIDLPSADLLICKDVLQHLPIEDILLFLSQCPKFKYCLITNDVDHYNLSSSNPEVEKGGHRGLDLSQPPFSIKGDKVLIFPSGDWIKQVFLIVNSN